MLVKLTPRRKWKKVEAGKSLLFRTNRTVKPRKDLTFKAYNYITLIRNLKAKYLLSYKDK
jgi:hypothetical protein